MAPIEDELQHVVPAASLITMGYKEGVAVLGG